MDAELEGMYIKVLKDCLDAIKDVDRTGDTQVFSHYVAPALVPAIQQLLDAYALRSDPAGLKVRKEYRT